MKRTIIILLIINLTTKLFAQLPNTDIWLLDIKAEKDTIILSNPVNITNRVGYDNQPSFSADGNSILYTSIRDEKQSDIYTYNIKTKTTTQFTNTPTTSEYSPNFTPDGKNISVVMVEPDSAQRLWKFPLKGGAPQLVMDKVDSIGYYCWLDNTHAALFLITTPFKFIITDLTTQESTAPIRDTIGRSFHLVKTKDEKKFFYSYYRGIYSLNLTGKKETRCETIKRFEGEDFCFIEPHKIIMGDGPKLYLNNFKLSNDDGKLDWTELSDLSKYGIKKITRIAISPDGKKMAIVAE
ncbi:MAG: hypothetical protein JWP12_3012 [Bacteroidetes bacterium]|nr:hypothetical protein [Bacteroidota bacterium]